MEGPPANKQKKHGELTHEHQQRQQQHQSEKNHYSIFYRPQTLNSVYCIQVQSSVEVDSYFWWFLSSKVPVLTVATPVDQLLAVSKLAC